MLYDVITDSSLIGTDRSIIVVNAAGYRVSGQPLLDFNKHDGRLLGTMFPGLTRIDVDDSGCQTVCRITSYNVCYTKLLRMTEAMTLTGCTGYRPETS